MTQASTNDQGSGQDIDAKKAAAIEELLSIRGSIDNIDAAVIHMLAERFKCTKRVGVLKAENDIPPSDVDREQRQIERLRKLAIDADLDAEFAEKFLNFIIREVIRNHLALRE
jgi:chorismate mutase